MESENNKKIDLSIPAMTISFGTKSSNTSVANVFASKGIKTIRDLCMCSEEELVRLPTVGYGRSLHIRKFLKMYGLELGMTEDEADREIRQIADEGAVSGSILDKLEIGGAE